jgi:hypothetical protein
MITLYDVRLGCTKLVLGLQVAWPLDYVIWNYAAAQARRLDDRHLLHSDSCL